jgi:diguanylate cyclase (GGDEF)-like protein
MTVYDDNSDKTRIDISHPSPAGIHRQDAIVQIYPPGPTMGKKWELTDTTMFIGRDAACDIVVDNTAVSRRHASLSVTGVNRFLSDLQSTNGTFVNNQQIISHPLAQGDQIKIGDAIFKYLVGSDVESAYHEEIYRMTIIDGLTGICNKRYFLDELARETARAARYQRHLSLIMFDIDHFKSVNDTWGHLAGDAVLAHLARIIRERTRKDEIFARWGGEEFAILLPESPLDAAVGYAETLRRMVEDSRVEFGSMPIRITISMGVASIRGEDMSVDAFIQLADRQLYRAKREGRNRVCS